MMMLYRDDYNDDDNAVEYNDSDNNDDDVV